jgi:hypothetical protein
MFNICTLLSKLKADCPELSFFDQTQHGILLAINIYQHFYFFNILFRRKASNLTVYNLAVVVKMSRL